MNGMTMNGIDVGHHHEAKNMTPIERTADVGDSKTASTLTTIEQEIMPVAGILGSIEPLRINRHSSGKSISTLLRLNVAKKTSPTPLLRSRLFNAGTCSRTALLSACAL
jgi:hypothetical protein